MFRFFGYEITIRKITALEKLTPEQVDNRAKSYKFKDFSLGYRKIPRIKAIRELAPGTSLREAEEWVETNFLD